MSGYECPWCGPLFTAVVASIVTKDHEPVCAGRPANPAEEPEA